MQEIYIIDGARTPVGVLQGSLSDVSAIDLGVVAAKGALERSGVDPQLVDQVVIGNVIQSSKDAIYRARLTITLMYELGRHQLKYGAASLCIGGGQGIAAIIE